jgi:HD-GYP domain-containing protein (c-di-GMP phosphodiesterase class II)
MSEEFINQVREDVIKHFRDNAPPENVYHNLGHTTEVVDGVKEIAQAEGINNDDLELILIAAWFHDLGYVKCCNGHEDLSIEYARNFLNDNRYPEDKIQKITSLIDATRMPQNPKNKLEEILCDADLHHLGTKNTKQKGDLFRLEMEKRNQIVCTDEEWLETSIKFMNQHKFFTGYAIEKFGVQKNINLIKIEKQLKKLKKKNKDSKLKEEKIEIDKQKIESKKKLEKGAGRSIETMFRNTMRTHVSFSSMADTKANIMISVNTLILTILVTIMLRKLDTNPHLIIPTAMLTLTSLITLVYAILVTRPKVTAGTFTEDDIKKKKANLLFFGNFYNMPLKDFTWGMNEMITDQEYLYDNMIKDFYYLGQVLGTKYKKLRICYTLFMYGVIISVIAYTIAFILFPGGTDLGPIIE